MYYFHVFVNVDMFYRVNDAADSAETAAIQYVSAV
jgi:hypothetical protein